MHRQENVKKDNILCVSEIRSSSRPAIIIRLYTTPIYSPALVSHMAFSFDVKRLRIQSSRHLKTTRCCGDFRTRLRRQTCTTANYAAANCMIFLIYVVTLVPKKVRLVF